MMGYASANVLVWIIEGWGVEGNAKAVYFLPKGGCAMKVMYMGQTVWPLFGSTSPNERPFSGPANHVYVGVGGMQSVSEMNRRRGCPSALHTLA